MSYSRWNREGDNNLNFPSFITKNWWSALGSNVGAFRISGAFTLKITYVKYISGSGNNYNYYSKVLHYTVPISDSDGDGVSMGMMIVRTNLARRLIEVVHYQQPKQTYILMKLPVIL